MQRLVRIMARLDQAGAVGVERDRLIAIGEYGDADPGSQLALDLKRLREQGWQIDNIAGPGEGARYRMVPGDNRLRLKLTPGQWAALQKAVILADRDDLAAALGVGEAALPAGVDTHLVPTQNTELTLALSAVQSRCRIRFSYKGAPRLLHPAAVRFSNHQWYLSGIEDGQDAVKHFAIGRMSQASLEPPGSARPIAEVRTIPLHPLLWAVDEPLEVVLEAGRDYVPDVERWLRQPEHAEAVGDAVRLTYTVTNRAAFRARIYVLGSRVRVLGPEEFRTEMLDELRALAGA